MAILHHIHHAILTSPHPSEILKIEFTFLVNDHPESNVWSLSRADSPKEVNNTWPMPDYDFWNWPEPHIGSMPAADERITRVEPSLRWQDKKSKALWRVNTTRNKNLRGKLVEVSKG